MYQVELLFSSFTNSKFTSPWDESLRFSQRRKDQEVKSAAHLPCRISSEMRVIARSTIEIDVATTVDGGEEIKRRKGSRARRREMKTFHAKARRERRRKRERVRERDDDDDDAGASSSLLKILVGVRAAWKDTFFRAENLLLSNGAPIQGHLNCPKGPCNMLQHATHVERKIQGYRPRSDKGAIGKGVLLPALTRSTLRRGNIMTIRYGTAI